MIHILFFMILCHIVDDFVLQETCLVNLKQRKWWEINAPEELYKNDYKVGLFIHSLSWSIMIHLPLFLLFHLNGLVAIITVLLNCAIHYYVDDLKANKFKINLITDQSIHLAQVILTFIIYNII